MNRLLAEERRRALALNEVKMMIGDGVPPEYADQADDVIRKLGEVVELLER